ncbi:MULTISPECIES: MerR family transcriptional regulator [Polaromonas]|uniref:MerR family transcriptional regulator n=1 Tax=Polaromonas aquatica TaxID=332657 RepID=A0ABW1TXP1_9BURK
MKNKSSSQPIRLKVQVMKIGELALNSGCPASTIRYYELERLLSAPKRSKGNFRLYEKHDLVRLSFIMQCRSMGLNIEEVRTFLEYRDHPRPNCEKIAGLLEKHIGKVGDEIRMLQDLKRELTRLRGSAGNFHR